MRLKELNDAIAAACNVRANVVSKVQDETFRAMRAAFDKGEKVQVPDFGIFMIKDVEGEGGAPGKKLVRFRLRGGEKGDKKGKKGKAGKENQNGAHESDDEGDDE